MKTFIKMNKFDQQRLQMVEDQIRRRGIKDKRVLNAMETVPRHLFVDKPHKQLA